MKTCVTNSSWMTMAELVVKMLHAYRGTVQVVTREMFIHIVCTFLHLTLSESTTKYFCSSPLYRQYESKGMCLHRVNLMIIIILP